MYGLVNETKSFLVNPGPESLPDRPLWRRRMILIWKSDGLVNETARFLENPGPEASEPGRVARSPFYR